ncbi:hypothetical protein BDY17DRAFT_298529 [Neohortaea acidophila]|uniref:Uncharacterized protein n=1 Tax=Neohortaea acidophila TaxID=245834 RepID=A0A6A6PR91_9PEZI|nr:uncharacterized protein BDY17DRAFT_298529 [Neohortaea acidophila]KAF2482435.1 hypothetical protein BDY17DRAFT_298529 [Neohortaea acidophila]
MFVSPLLHDNILDFDDNDDMGLISRSRAPLGSNRPERGSRSDMRASHRAAYGSDKMGDAARTPSSSSDGSKSDSCHVNGPPPYVEGANDCRRSEKAQHAPSDNEATFPDNATQPNNEKAVERSDSALATASNQDARGRKHWKGKLHQRRRSSLSGSSSGSSSSGSSMSLHSLRNKIHRKINQKFQRRFGRS